MPCVENNKSLCGVVTHWSQPEADIVELSDWINRNLDKDEAIASSMNTSGTLRALANIRTIIHPHFEDNDLRQRVQEFYEVLYHCLTPEEAATKFRRFKSRYLVIEIRRCMVSPYILDPPLKSCAEDETNSQNKDLFCRQIFQNPKFFELRFINAGFGLFELMELDSNGERIVPLKAQAKYNSFTSKKLWSNIANNSCTDDEKECGGRLAELAFSLEEGMHERQCAEHILKTISKRYNNSVTKYYLARFRDYIHDKKDEETLRLYKEAFDGLSTNPAVAKEYILFLDYQMARHDEGAKVANRWLKNKEARREDSLDFWDASLEMAMAIKPSDHKRAIKVWHDIQVNGPTAYSLGEYWQWFSTTTRFNETVGTSWNKIRNLLIDHNIRCMIPSLKVPSIRTASKDNNWKVSFSV